MKKKMFRTLLSYEIRNTFRNKWIFGYLVFFFILTELFYQFSPDSSKVFISLMNIMLISIPLVSIIYGTQFIYNSREFIQVLLSQPIDRTRIFFSSYFTSLTAVCGSFVIGSGLPLIIHEADKQIGFALLLIASGAMLSAAYLSVAYLISYKFNDKAKGIMVSLTVWFTFSLLYDGLLMFALFALRDFPLEYPAMFLSILNPNDLTRMLLILNLDISAIMGFTGAIYKDFFGTATGLIISFSVLGIWIIIPLTIALRIFKKKDF